ncbi:hypothetical protein DYB31_008844 [Aphanomyces astaci]|uniref:Uncharacterized protein n=2 Tax=Aphanomyces astaci TaxID=112090 RepID=A0A397FDZ3_APHAT|nr:hypothetical protein DYB31_008844 [Aphanomyces astaci]
MNSPDFGLPTSRKSKVEQSLRLHQWALAAFQLPKLPAKSTMSGWLTERETCQHTLPSRKSNHMPHWPELEVSLMRIRMCEEWKVPIVTEPTIRAKVEKNREAASFSVQAVEDGKRCLHDEVTRDYDKCNIFNMEVTAYFYCTTHRKTICFTRIPGKKKIKKGITVAVTSDESSKWPFLQFVMT